MKRIAFCGDDVSLAKEFRRLEPDCEFVSSDPSQLPNGMEACDFLLVSDRLVEAASLGSIVSRYQAARTYYLISSRARQAATEHIISLCGRMGIEAIPPGHTAGQIARRVLSGTAKVRGSGTVVSVMGTHPQAGATMTALCLAERMGAAAKIKTAVLGLNANNPGLVFFKGYSGTTLDELYAHMADGHGSWSPDGLARFVHRDERGFDYLAGNQDFTKRRYYDSGNIERLIEAAAESYDLVILDAGFSPDSNLTLQALFRSELRMLVGTQQPLSAALWKRMNVDILRLLSLSIEEFALVVNRFSPDLPLEGNKLQTAFGVPLLAEIPDFGIEGVICEMEKKLLTESGDRKVRRRALLTYESLAAAVSERLHLPAGGRTAGLRERGKPTLWSRIGL